MTFLQEATGSFSLPCVSLSYRIAGFNPRKSTNNLVKLMDRKKNLIFLTIHFLISLERGILLYTLTLGT